MTVLTQTLDDLVTALVAKGNLTHLSLAMNSTHSKWVASYAPAKGFGKSVAEDIDPVKALKLAIGATKQKLHVSPATISQTDVDVTGTAPDPAPDATGQPLPDDDMSDLM